MQQQEQCETVVARQLDSHRKKVKLNSNPVEHYTKAQKHILKDDAAVERLNNVLTTLIQNETLRSLIDPLLPENRNITAKLPFKPTVEYLGVLVDAGRHYFPMDWLRQLIPFLHQLNYNMIHLRLTDDQAFNLQLESYPELSKKSSWSEKDSTPYTPKELRELVSFAKEHGIMIVPEINVPGHGGAWAGIPYMTVQCPSFICQKGYGVPLNIEHPKFKSILKGILREVLDIFDNPPFLHLGGDEVSMAWNCFKEAGIEPFEYKGFETTLKGILKELGYPENQVIRWEETPQLQSATYDPDAPRPSFRAGTIEQYWHDVPGFRSDDKGAIVDNTPPRQPYFISRKLYFDTNHDSGAPDIFTSTVGNLQLGMGPDYFPTGVIVGTFELDPAMWMQRNVAGRLIAVSMGVSQLKLTNHKAVLAFYDKTCRETLGLNPLVCDLQGFTALPFQFFTSRWKTMWQSFKLDICNRMTDRVEKMFWKDLEAHRIDNFHDGNTYMWQTMKEAFSNKAKTDATQEKIETRSTQTGVILDLVNGMGSFNRSAHIVEKFLAPLSVSLLQLRLVDNHAFAIMLDRMPNLGFSIEQQDSLLPNASDVLQLVNLASRLDIQTFPEISVSTNAGGWAFSGYLVECPETYCKEDSLGEMAVNITEEELLPVMYGTIRELYGIFSTETNTMPYLHLGSDERESNRHCFRESGLKVDPPYASFERDLTVIVQDMIGIPTQKVLRWENSERVRYEDRTGQITHYPSTDPFVVPNTRTDEPFFVTIDILKQASLFDVFKNTKALMLLKPLAVFAELRRFDEEAWDKLQIELRLTAFNMGTQFDEHKIDDKSTFHQTLSSECLRAGFFNCKLDTHVESVGRWLSSDNEKPYFYESKKARDDICGLFAHQRFVRVMKEEMMGDENPS